MSRRAVLLACALWTGCGAKTGLLIPDASFSMDATVDAGPDGQVMCPTIPVTFTRRNVETLLVLDRSGSMGNTWNDLPGGSGEPSRWQIVHDTLAMVLPPYNDRLAIGAKLSPTPLEMDLCGVSPALEVRPHVGAVNEVLALFGRWVPYGGTPTAEALRLALAALDTGTDTPRVIVVALDGGPNCNPDTGVPPDMCVCTGPRSNCLQAPPTGPEECLDSARTLDVVRTAYQDHGVPVVVVGIDDPSRPDLSDFLDQMAVAGGWPRPVGSRRRFYDARQPDDLRLAFGDIVHLLSRCVLTASTPVPAGATASVSIGSRSIPRDPMHVDGWDWTDRSHGTLALFGASCDLLGAGTMLTAEFTCPDE